MTVTPVSSRIEAADFRQVMAELAAGVAVVTTIDEDGEPRGLTTTALTSASLDPPLVLVCIGFESRSLPALRSSGHFAVNLVRADAAAIAVRFASKSPDKFADTTWRSARNGSPVLHDAAVAWLECRVEREIEVGDHAVFVGLVEHCDIHRESRSPLTYHRRRFGTWAPEEGGTNEPRH